MSQILTLSCKLECDENCKSQNVPKSISSGRGAIFHSTSSAFSCSCRLSDPGEGKNISLYLTSGVRSLCCQIGRNYDVSLKFNLRQINLRSPIHLVLVSLRHAKLIWEQRAAFVACQSEGKLDSTQTKPQKHLPRG